MSKYGEGLGIEVVNAIKSGELKEPITTKSIRELCEIRAWKPSDKFINVLLANSSAEKHSLTYKKYFERVSKGEYCLAKDYKKN
jgi:hypothetical protein